VLIVFYAVIPVTLGLVLVAALSRARVRGQAGFRTVLFLPQVIPMVVVAVIWRMIYAPQDGSLNELLRAVGLDSLARPWLGDFGLALPAVGVVGTWVMCGLALVLFMAGVQRIPQSLYDAARVDGAGPVREFFAVTLPNLRGEIAVALTLTTIAALRNFDLVYLTTQGGPGDATSVPAFQVWNRAFQVGQIGSAAAVGFSLALVIFAISFLITRIGERR
jgi:raffinose/stachyose/melibiose transport system permease protein